MTFPQFLISERMLGFQDKLSSRLNVCILQIMTKEKLRTVAFDDLMHLGRPYLILLIHYSACLADKTVECSAGEGDKDAGRFSDSAGVVRTGSAPTSGRQAHRSPDVKALNSKTAARPETRGMVGLSCVATAMNPSSCQPSGLSASRLVQRARARRNHVEAFHTSE